MTADLASWLRAQLDAEQALAQRLADRYVYKEGGMMRPEFWGQRYWPAPGIARVFRDLSLKDPQGKDAVFVEGLDLIEAFSPWRVLDEVSMKRRIVHVHVDQRECERCAWFDDEHYPCETLRLIASVYADRAGYDESWRA